MITVQASIVFLLLQPRPTHVRSRADTSAKSHIHDRRATCSPCLFLFQTPGPPGSRGGGRSAYLTAWKWPREALVVEPDSLCESHNSLQPLDPSQRGSDVSWRRSPTDKHLHPPIIQLMFYFKGILCQDVYRII